MLRSMKRVCGFAVQALDGGTGKVGDFCFDDQSWQIRYLVVETGDWLLRHKVLLSPVVIDQLDWDAHSLRVNLTQLQVEHSPDIDTDQPVSRQHEQALHRYYTWMPYWTASGSMPMIVPTAELETEATEHQPADPHLRSLRQVIGYHLQTLDDELGHIEDFVASDVTWTITYLLVDTHNLLPGRRVLVPSTRVDSVSWSDRKVSVKLPRTIIDDSPAVDLVAALSVNQEQAVCDYYERLKTLLQV